MYIVVSDASWESSQLRKSSHFLELRILTTAQLKQKGVELLVLTLLSY